MKTFNKHLCIHCLLVLEIFLFCFNSNTTVKADAFDKSKNNIQRYLRKEKINGLVLIGNNKKKICIRNTLPCETQQLVQGNTYFPIASLQKFITGVAIYDLISKGMLSYDRSINSFFPSKPFKRNIKISDLLSHDSGIKDTYIIPQKPINSEERRIDFAIKHLKSTTSYKWNYSSANYELLAAIIAKISNTSYYDYVSKNVFNGNDIRPFNLVEENEVTLPFNPQGIRKKKLILNSIFYSFMPKHDANLVWWYDLEKIMSSNVGAGDFLATPNEYWNFFQHALKKRNMISNWKIMANEHEHYFGGLYFKDNIVYANGVVGDYNSCFVASNLNNGKTIMLFSNNLTASQLKQVEKTLFLDYLGTSYKF